ncbi:MAG: hypothetical protein N3A61_08120, partial [Ignavibacteria bacterium]|nr:hypothetical protein [Ignavibacteria bacterium]
MINNKNILILFYLAVFSVNYLFSQIQATSINKLNLPLKGEWSNPIFSPDSKKIYFTNSSYNGIWEFDLINSNFRKLTDDNSSGYNFTISEDGEFISYRRTSYPDGVNRLQEIVVMDLKNLSKQVLESGAELSTPIFIQDKVIFTNDYRLKNLNSVSLSNEVKVLGIELTKIALLIDGKKVLLDPFGNGSYIWPSLSPDKK